MLEATLDGQHHTSISWRTVCHGAGGILRALSTTTPTETQAEPRDHSKAKPSRTPEWMQQNAQNEHSRTKPISVIHKIKRHSSKKVPEKLQNPPQKIPKSSLKGSPNDSRCHGEAQEPQLHSPKIHSDGFGVPHGSQRVPEGDPKSSNMASTCEKKGVWKEPWKRVSEKRLEW